MLYSVVFDLGIHCFAKSILWKVRSHEMQGINDKCIYPLYTGRHFHCYMLDKSICYFGGDGGGGVYFVAFIGFFLWKILLANNVGPDQMPHYVASDLGLHCLPKTLLWVSMQEWDNRHSTTLIYLC